jgi:lysozyme
MTRQIDAAGVMIIHGAEGCARKLPNGNYAAYADPGSGGEPWTIGWGSTGPDIHLGMVWTQAQCDARLARTLADMAVPLDAAMNGAATTDNQFSAMGSLAYNIGMHNFLSSSVLRFHRIGEHHEAAQAFAAWNKAGGRVMLGLTRRRVAEAALYLTPDTP